MEAIEEMRTIKNFKDLPPALSVKEAAKALGVSRRVAYHLTRKNDFPSIRLGEKRIIILRDKLIEWLHENAKKAI